MSWRCKEPGHQQPWYWPSSTEITRSGTLRIKPPLKSGHGWVIRSHTHNGCDHLSMPKFNLNHVSDSGRAVLLRFLLYIIPGKLLRMSAVWGLGQWHLLEWLVQEKWFWLSVYLSLKWEDHDLAAPSGIVTFVSKYDVYLYIDHNTDMK